MSLQAFFRFSVCSSLLLLLGLSGCADKAPLPAPAQRPVIAQAPTPRPAKVKPVTSAPLPPPPFVPNPAFNPTPPQPAQPPAPQPPQAGSLGTSAQLNQGKTAVAILLPLSGKNAALGQAMLNAAQLAIFDLAADNFQLMPRDTGASADSAALAARDALGSGAKLIIGPLFAADVSAVKPVVQTSAATMLALSSDTSLAEPGAYVMGFAPASLTERLASYAQHRGLSRFAAITPNNNYGRLVLQAFGTSLIKHGGNVVASATYSQPADINLAVQQIATHKNEIDALFIPAGGAELQQIANALSAAGFDKNKVRLLGSGLWDEGDLGQNPFLLGGWYAAAEPEARLNFNANYTNTYGSAPPRLATLAYDATALAIVLAKRGSSFDRTALTNPSGFSGLDGIFRLTPQGLAERGLAINEVVSGGSKIIDPAPSTFVGQ